LAEERQAIAEEPCVAPLHALDSHAGGANGRRGRLHAETAHLVQHHDDVAGSHQKLLLDFIATDDFDSGRLVLEASAGSCAGHHHDFFFEIRPWRQLDFNAHGLALSDLEWLPGVDVVRVVHCYESRSGGHLENNEARLVGDGGDRSDGDGCAGDRSSFTSDRNADLSLRWLSAG
jgi:hypothetical protein